MKKLLQYDLNIKCLKSSLHFKNFKHMIATQQLLLHMWKLQYYYNFRHVKLVWHFKFHPSESNRVAVIPGCVTLEIMNAVFLWQLVKFQVFVKSNILAGISYTYHFPHMGTSNTANVLSVSLYCGCRTLLVSGISGVMAVYCSNCKIVYFRLTCYYTTLQVFFKFWLS